jgi:hypothetical protein
LELPFEVFTSLVFAVLGDLAVGMPRTAQVFFIMAYCVFCIVNCGESLGIIFNTLFDHAGFAINVTSIFLSLAQIMAGSMSINMPAVLRALNYLSPLRYALAVLAQYAFRGIRFTCNVAQRLPNGNCPQTTGEEVLRLYKLDTGVKLNLMALGIATIVYRLVAYAVLKTEKSRIFSRSWTKSQK